MLRAPNLFATASIVLLTVGLIMSNFFEKSRSIAVTLPGSHLGYIFGCEVPCYGLAGLFAIFASSYALGWIRLNESAVNWHLWLSLVGVAAFGFGFALFSRVVAEGTAPQPGQGTLLVIAIGMFLGAAAFVAGQLLLTIALLARLATPNR